MKRICFLLLLAAATPAAAAGETLIPINDPALDLPMALGKQINVRFSEGFAKGRLTKTDFDGVVLSELKPDAVCLFGRNQGLDPDDPKLKDVVRSEQGDICVAHADVAVRVVMQAPAYSAPVPFFSTDKANCVWSWKTGKGIGLWTEDCRFESGHWTVSYDETADLFALRVDEGEPYPVLRQFRIGKGQGPDALLPALKAKGLIRDTEDCVFAPSTDQKLYGGWSAWDVVPAGKLKEAFDALPQDEVPEPPCGEIGLAVDSIGFFMIHKDHPDRVLHVNLGQDGTMIEPFTVKLF